MQLDPHALTSGITPIHTIMSAFSSENQPKSNGTPPLLAAPPFPPSSFAPPWAIFRAAVQGRRPSVRPSITTCRRCCRSVWNTHIHDDHGPERRRAATNWSCKCVITCWRRHKPADAMVCTRVKADPGRMVHDCRIAGDCDEMPTAVVVGVHQHGHDAVGCLVVN